MSSEVGEHYYVGCLPQPPLASSDLIETLIRKFGAFRVQALKEHDRKALGRSEYDAETQRSRQSYYDDLVNPQNFWFACFVAPAGLDGNCFRNVSKTPSAEYPPSPSVTEGDERIMREGRWIGLCSGHGPFTSDEWHLQYVQGQILPDDIESRFHLANLYFLEDDRGIKLANGESLFMTLCLAVHDMLQRLAVERTTRKPAYCRLRGTITPTAMGTKLWGMYEAKLRYHITGWVPQVTAMLLNKAQVVSWPPVAENVPFYTACHFPTFEKLVKRENGRWYVLSETTPRGEVWAKL